MKAGKSAAKNGKLICLTPYMDKDGLIRITGRIVESHLDNSQKNRVIEPHNSHLTTLLMDYVHECTLHG